MLWNILGELGMPRGVVQVLQTLYRDHKSKIQTKYGLTKWVKCNRGVKQGCYLSPLLFTLFLAEIDDRLIKSGIGIEVKDATIPDLFLQMT